MEQQNSTAPVSQDQTEAPPSVWRDEVQARVAGYRTRRGRRIEGAFSMRFPFPPLEPAARDVEAEPAPEIETEALRLKEDAFSEEGASPGLASLSAPEVTDNAGSCTEAEPEILPAPPEADSAPDHDEPRKPVGAPRSRRKVIAFPKPVADSAYPLDDPLLPEQPRILDVGEEFPFSPSTPLLDGLVFPSQNAPSAAAQADHIELPLQAVAVGQRLYAGFVDCALVAAAAGVFVAAGYKLLPKSLAGKPLLLACAAMLVLLWAAYQYIFLVYAGRTAGMQQAGIRLSSFKGGFPNRRQRRNRAIALFFSTASLMMGLFWVLVDVDALCWHDRISRTYMTKGVASN